MAPVTLPPSFYNSFWSPDYRSGLETLFQQLELGCHENNEVAEFVESQVKGHHDLARTLLAPPLSGHPASSSSLSHTLLSLRGASSARGEAHRALALELESRILVGFTQWKDRHGDRVKTAKDDVLGKNGVVKSWEKDVQKLNTAKQSYMTKTRAADDSEDDAKFAPPTTLTPSSSVESYTASPPPKSAHVSNLRRAGTVADRISEKLRAASVSKLPSSLSGELKPVMSVDGKTLPPPPSPLRPLSPEAPAGPAGMHSPTSPTKEEKFIPPSSPEGKPTIHGPAVPSKDGERPTLDVQPPPILLSGLSLPAQGLKDLLQRLDAYLLTTPAPYSDASVQSTTRSNAALASRARSSMLGTYEKTFSGEEVVEWLKENVEGFGGDWERCVEAASELYKMGHFSRVGVGRGFEANYDTYFILKVSPSETTSTAGLSSPLSPATSGNIQNLLKSYLPASMGTSDEPAHIRLRREANKANEVYKEAVAVAEDKRLDMEEMIEKGLRLWERWERERLSVLRQVLNQYEEAISKLAPRLGDLQGGTSVAIEAFNPEADIKALIEGNRTGPFRPQSHIYESLESDVPNVNFGIDLRRWSGDHGWKSAMAVPQREKGAIPEALTGILQAVSALYADAPDDEKRKAWIYEVPLHETHILRNSINNSSLSVEDIVTIVQKYNLPIAAAAVKLYFLELSPPVMGWEGWEDAKAVYPAVGADQERDVKSALSSVLGRLPGIQLFTLNAIVKHWKDLVDSTKTEESNEVYVTKLALSLGRCILRPQFETDVTIQDRTPALFLADLINHYEEVFPSLVENKKKDAERVMPVRKRTALVDQRISRSRLSAGSDTQQLLEAQHAFQHPKPTSSVPEATPSKISRTAPQLELNLGPKVNEPPMMAEPKDSDDEGEGSAPVQVVPPSSNPKPESQVHEQHQPEEGEASATADILESMQSTLEADGDKVIAGQAAGLKRATSGETSRLRGPRGARGPRPAPGRGPSHGNNPSISMSAAEGEQVDRDGAVTPTPGSGRSSPALGASGTYAPSKGRGHTNAGAFSHGSRGSVSAAVAAFETSGSK